MTASIDHYHQQECCGIKRLPSFLQSSYSKQFQWITPLLWKPNYKFPFDQIHVKDVRFTQEVYNDNVILLRSCTPQLVGNDFMTNLLSGLNQLDIRLATVQGKMGCGKSIFLQKIIQDWCKASGKSLHRQPMKYFLYCNLKENIGRDFHKLDIEEVASLFDIPDYLCDELLWLIENHGEDIVLFIDIEDINSSSRLLFKLFHNIFLNSKFMLFYRPDISDSFKELPQSQELFYLLRKRIEVKLHQFEVKQILSLVKQTSSNSIMYQNFRDSLHENSDLRRLCKNPFLCMAIISLCKDSKGMKFVENKLLFIRRTVVAIWKRYSKLCDNQSETDMIRHIDRLLITMSKEAIDCYAQDGYFTEQDILLNEHTPLLIDAGLLEEKSFDDQTECGLYAFFDPLLHEYTCALFYAEMIIDRPDESYSIVNTLFSMKWRNVCILVAGLLGKRFSLVVDKLNFELIDEQTLLILAEGLQQCQCPSIAMRNVKKLEIPKALDFSTFNVSSSTFKGLQFLVEWSQESTTNQDNNNSINASTNNLTNYENRRNSLRYDYQKLALERFFTVKKTEESAATTTDEEKPTGVSSKRERRKKYNSCPNLSETLTALRISFEDIDIGSGENSEKEISWSGHYQAHISKQTSLANLQSIANKSKTIHTSPTRPSSVYGSQQWLDNLSEALSRSESAFSLCSSLETLSVKKTSVIKELRIKGSGLANRSYASLITFLRSNELDGLFLMDQFNNEDESYHHIHLISNKLVGKFLEVITTMSELTLNSNHLGANWVSRLCEIVESDSTIKYISIAVANLNDLSVENAINLVKSMRHNKTIIQIELYCGIQPIVIQTSLSFFVDILEKDDRLIMTFL